MKTRNVPTRNNLMKQRREKRLGAYNGRKEILKKYPRLRSVLNRNPNAAINVTIREENDKEVLIVSPQKKRLTKEEKLALSKKLAGSADRFSLEGIEETIRIANREYDQEEEA